MEVICINDSFITESIIRIPNRPIAGSIYTIRDVINYLNGKVGFLLEEIFNPELEDGFGIGTFEPSFSRDRFTKLDGTEITEQDLREALETANSNQEYLLNQEQ